MDADTIRRLNNINHDFYRTTAEDFDQTRGEAWPGWHRLSPYLDRPLTVLDVGCGNGRFGLFLAQHLTRILVLDEDAPTARFIMNYHGIDSSRTLLDKAAEALGKLPGVRARLEERDIVQNPPDTGQYDLVVLLGVLHHIPGYQQRQTFMRHLAERVKPDGLLVFAAWRFYEYERFRQRIVPWPDDLTVEQGDYLLDWRRGAVSLRYCHYTDDAEHDALVKASGLREILTYRADGQTGDANRYSVLERA